MLKIAIIDDELSAFEKLKALVEMYNNNHNIEWELTYFSKTVHFMDEYQKGAFDIVFLDICVPKLNGMNLAHKLREVDKDVIIIFITNMQQYAIKGYEVNALGYVLKPVDQFTFNKLMDKATALLDKEEKQSIIIHTADGFIRTRIDTITYIEIQGHKIHYFFVDGTDIYGWGSLNAVESTLSQDNFYRCNVCYLVNMSQVQGIENDEVVVAGTKLKIARARKKDFLGALAKYWGGKGAKNV